MEDSSESQTVLGSARVDADDVARAGAGSAAAAAAGLVAGLFAPRASIADRIEYAVQYRLAGPGIGGDVVDVYQFDNESVSFSLADISGKGADAAVYAALVKYGVRAYASEMYSAEKVLLSLDRLYQENTAFDGRESFCTAFYAHVDARREVLSYASAAHEGAFLVRAGAVPELLPVTAPLIGIFARQHHLFHERYIAIAPGDLLVVVSDGIVDARKHDAFFGTDRVARTIADCRDAPMETLARTLIERVRAFTEPDDDMAVLAVRFH